LQPHQPHQAIELGLTEAENDNVIAAFIHPFKR
jgi:hypothetical protein